MNTTKYPAIGYTLGYSASDRIVQFSNGHQLIEFSKNIGADAFQVTVYRTSGSECSVIYSAVYDHTTNRAAGSCLTSDCDFDVTACEKFIPTILSTNRPPPTDERQLIATVWDFSYRPGVAATDWNKPGDEDPYPIVPTSFSCPNCGHGKGVDLLFTDANRAYDATLCLRCWNVFQIVYSDDAS